MEIIENRPVMIFRKDNEFGTFYKVGLSKKDFNGNYVNGYKDIRFKKGVVLENQTKIYIKKAWIDFYLKDNFTRDYIFVSEFETLDETNEQTKYQQIAEQDPYAEMGQIVNDYDLPF